MIRSSLQLPSFWFLVFDYSCRHNTSKCFSFVIPEDMRKLSLKTSLWGINPVGYFQVMLIFKVIDCNSYCQYFRKFVCLFFFKISDIVCGRLQKELWKIKLKWNIMWLNDFLSFLLISKYRLTSVVGLALHSQRFMTKTREAFVWSLLLTLVTEICISSWTIRCPDSNVFSWETLLTNKNRRKYR